MMTMEMKVLGWCVLLGLVQVGVAIALATQQRGLQWNAGNRDGEVRPLLGAAARASRASQNFQETFPFFVAAVLAISLAKTNGPHTALGAQLYFWARLVYFPVYIVGIPYLRTLVWMLSLWGLLQVCTGLF